MPRKKNHTSLYHMVQYYITLYYIEVSLNPDILTNNEERYQFVDSLNDEYKSDLAARHPDWHNEDSKNYFRDHIDYLTGIYRTRDQETSIRNRSAILAEKVYEKLERNKRIRSLHNN